MRGNNDSEFIKDYKKAWYMLKHGDLDRFDNKEAPDSMPFMPSCIHASELVEKFIEKVDIIELKDNNFWDVYDGGDLQEDNLPTAIFQIALKNTRHAQIFDNVEWRTAFDITQ